MPVTKTAKRALRVSHRKKDVNDTFKSRLEIALREAKKKKTNESAKKALTLVDKAVKNKLLHKNKAARIKSKLSKFIKGAALKNKPQKKGRK